MERASILAAVAGGEFADPKDCRVKLPTFQA